MVATGLLASVFLQLFDVGRMCDSVDCQVYCECAQSKSETGEDVACKEAVREDGVLTPCFALGPRVSVHLCHLEVLIFE